jgi:hypothetical protein
LRILAQGDFIVGTPIDVMKYRRRQAPFCQLSKVFRLVAVFQPHSFVLIVIIRPKTGSVSWLHAGEVDCENWTPAVVAR